MEGAVAFTLEGAALCSFLSLLHPRPFVFLWEKVSPVGGYLELHLCSPLGDFLLGLTVVSVAFGRSLVV